MSSKIGMTDRNKGDRQVVCNSKDQDCSNSIKMANSKDDALGKARKDLAQRLGLSDNDISEQSVEEADFPDTALGAGGEDEMSGQMITPGWRIRLQAKGKTYEYRADRNQLRLYDYKGKNHVV
jgi:hypothetical protein